MIKHLLLDLDETFLDFRLSEARALSRTLLHFGREPKPEVIEIYSAVNAAQWKLLEEKKITRAELRIRRFALFFEKIGERYDASEAADFYEEALSHEGHYLPGAEKMLGILSADYLLWGVTNGHSHTQRGRIAATRIDRFFQNIFISAEVGADKPSEEYFRYVFSHIPGFQPEEAVLVGDSLTSDIRGGSLMGLRTVWYHPAGTPNPTDIQPTVTVKSLAELPAILSRMKSGTDSATAK